MSGYFTQKHYSAWVKARQERAEADMMASWKSDPFILMETEAAIFSRGCHVPAFDADAFVPCIPTKIS